jgi:signal transduction histidine kinase
MPEYERIQTQLKSVAQIVSCELERVEDYLYFLEALTVGLFSSEPAAAEVEHWLEKDGFEVNSDGFYLSVPKLEAFRKNLLSGNEVSYSWSPDKKNDPVAAAHLFGLRNLGEILQTMHERLPSSVWMYYQDLTNVALQFPYIDQITAITPDFDWSSYHTYISVCPENNPEREVRWSSPHIDYAGQGLIIAASIPLYIDDEFKGLWSIDLQVEKLIRHEVLVADRKSQLTFIIDRHGALIASSSGFSIKEMAKGQVAIVELKDVHECFADIDPSHFFEEISGNENLASTQNSFQVQWERIPFMDWVCITAISVEELISTARGRFQKAFTHLGKGDSGALLKADSFSGEMLELAKSYNEMVMSLGIARKKLLANNLELTKQKIRAEMADRVKSDFLSNMSHELRTPLNGIIGMHNLLYSTSLDAEQKNYVDLAAESAKRLTVLVSDLLEMANVESSSAKPDESVFSLTEVFDSLRQLFGLPCSDDELVCLIEMDSEVPELVVGDSVRLSQVLHNLLSNAVKFTKSGEVVLRADLLPQTNSNLYNILFTVSDTGIGIDNVLLDTLFDIFTQADEGFERAYQGAGLGLAVVKELVSMMGGNISVDSSPGVGSSFYVRLPFGKAEN